MEILWEMKIRRGLLMKFQYEFVEFVPDKLNDGVLYISIPYATVSHKCPCGCGQEVVTPLTPTDWRLIFNGVSVSLYPSIGNWSFDCKSHYWVKENRILWASQWSDEEIELNRNYDKKMKNNYYGEDHMIDLDSKKSEAGQRTWIDFLRDIFK